MSDVKSDVVFKFRVKAESHHGWWSEYRTSNEPFNPQFGVEEVKKDVIPWRILSMGFILIIFFLAMFMKYCMLIFIIKYLLLL